MRPVTWRSLLSGSFAPPATAVGRMSAEEPIAKAATRAIEAAADDAKQGAREHRRRGLQPELAEPFGPTSHARLRPPHDVPG